MLNTASDNLERTEENCLGTHPPKTVPKSQVLLLILATYDGTLQLRSTLVAEMLRSYSSSGDMNQVAGKANNTSLPMHEDTSMRVPCLLLSIKSARSGTLAKIVEEFGRSHDPIDLFDKMAFSTNATIGTQNFAHASTISDEKVRRITDEAQCINYFS